MYINPLLFYSVIFFFLCAGDALVSYVTPIYIEQSLNSTFIMGLILSISSVFGLILDLLINKFLPNAGYKRLIRLTFFTTIAFALVMIALPPNYIAFVLGMLLWGMYYEFRGLTNYKLIHHLVTKEEHSKAWAMLITFSSIAYLMAPVVASFFATHGTDSVYIVALGTFAMALGLFWFFQKYILKNKHLDPPIAPKPQRSFRLQFSILLTLFIRIWPLAAYSFALILTDSAFWTIGTLFTEELKVKSHLGTLFISAYMAPTVFMGAIAPFIHKRLGKKRTAFVASIGTALSLLFISSTHSIYLILGLSFLTGIFGSVSSVLILAVFEDYVARLKEFGNDVASMEQASGSVAYIVGPILWGAIANWVGYNKTFAVSGIILGSIAIACLVTIPRKVKMPQTELKNLIE